MTLRGTRSGSQLSVELTASLGTSQLTQINSLGINQSETDFTLSAPQEVDRDYIVDVASIRDAGLWPVQSGDIFLDENDVDGVTNIYRVMSIPGQSPWRYLRGAYTDRARIHTKFYAPFAQLWSDAFTAANGTSLSSHAPDSPASGVYAGGSGTLTITSNRVRAGSTTAYTYYDHGGDDGTVSQVELSLNGVTAGNLEGKYAEFGLGVRCASSGAGLRNGYYCTLLVAYTDGEQATTRLRIFDATTERAYVDLPDVGLSTVYQLVVDDDLESITATLFDETGQVQIGSVRYATTTYAANTAGCVIFLHEPTLTNYDLPYIDDLTVES